MSRTIFIISYLQILCCDAEKGRYLARAEGNARQGHATLSDFPHHVTRSRQRTREYYFLPPRSAKALLCFSCKAGKLSCPREAAPLAPASPLDHATAQHKISPVSTGPSHKLPPVPNRRPPPRSIPQMHLRRTVVNRRTCGARAGPAARAVRGTISAYLAGALRVKAHETRVARANVRPRRFDQNPAAGAAPLAKRALLSPVWYRSGERRVGEEGRFRGSADPFKKKK